MSETTALECPVSDCREDRPHSAYHWGHRAADYAESGSREAQARRCTLAADFLRQQGQSPLSASLVAKSFDQE